MRCYKRGCGRRYSSRHPMFIYNECSQLSIKTILEIIWYWSNSHSIKYTTENYYYKVLLLSIINTYFIILSINFDRQYLFYKN